MYMLSAISLLGLDLLLMVVIDLAIIAGYGVPSSTVWYIAYWAQQARYSSAEFWTCFD